MDSEIICALISTAGFVVSVFFSFLVARHTARKEGERLKMELESRERMQRESFTHADVVSSDSAFSEMASYVAEFARDNIGLNQSNALRSVAAIRAAESGTLGEMLDRLYHAVSNGSQADADRSLNEVIREKRKRKENQR